jgi:CTP:molybdopterin cytidylyltransferase MocA
VASLSPRVVVLGHAAEEILATVELQGALPVVCERWADGQSASVRAGIAALGDVDAAVLLLGDMPRISRAAVEAVAAADLEGVDAARATYAGRPGHPVKLGRGLLDRAGELTGDAGFRALLKGAAIREVEVGDLAEPADVDTPEALAALSAGPPGETGPVGPSDPAGSPDQTGPVGPSDPAGSPDQTGPVGPSDPAGVCGGDPPAVVGGRLTGAGLTLDEAVAALERGEEPPLTPLQRRMVEEHAARR